MASKVVSFSGFWLSPLSVVGKRYTKSTPLSPATTAILPRTSSLHPAAQSQRATWLPGLEPPPHLDGSFDPLGLGEDPKDLKWYIQAERVHCRDGWCGWDSYNRWIRDLPVWYEAGAMKFEFANTSTLFIIQMLLMGFVETKRYMDYVTPGSQAMEGTFFGIEAALEGSEPGYPGGPLLNPLGLARDVDSARDWKLKEIKNGRLAMVAMLRFFMQANITHAITHAGPVENLIAHVSDPWHKTVIQTLIGS